MGSSREWTNIKKATSGDVQAFAKLVESHQNLIFTLCMRMLKRREDAEEVAQDTFVRAYKSLKKFKGNSKFSTWLYTIAYRLCLNRLEKSGRQPNIAPLEQKHHITPAQGKNSQELMEVKERRAIVQSHIQSLSSEDAALIGFYYFDEMSIKEIAKLTKMSPGNVKVRIHRSRKQLRERMTADHRLNKAEEI
jgi:RNA polymerase sigma-70 factor (ECF subfamily)